MPSGRTASYEPRRCQVSRNSDDYTEENLHMLKSKFQFEAWIIDRRHGHSTCMRDDNQVVDFVQSMWNLKSVSPR